MWRWLLAGLVVVLVAVAAVVWWAERQLQQPLPLAEPRLIEVPRGSSLGRVVSELAAAELLKWPELLRIRARLDDRASRIHAGEYLLEPGMTPSELLDMLVEGRVHRRQFTIIEGWRVSDLRAALRDAPRLRPETADWSEAELMARLERTGQAAEGRFFPATYDYLADSSDLELLRRAARRMDAVLAEEWSRRQFGLPLEDPDEALVLASIVEKETGHDPERPDIAGVFVRRLEKGMRLQTDPTVIYGLGEAYEPPLTRADLREPTPWNTYVHHGLPPTPIALPGRASIRATLNPRESDALYFVARGDGTSHFSATLEEHNSAVWRYLRSGRVPAHDNGE